MHPVTAVRRARGFRRAFFSALLLFAVTVAGALLVVVPRRIERQVRERLEAEAHRDGLEVRVRDVAFSWFRPLLLSDVSVEKPGRGQVAVQRMAVTWRLFARDLRSRIMRIALDGARASFSGNVDVYVFDSAWDVDVSRPGEARFRRVGGADTLTARLLKRRGETELELVLVRVDLGRLLRVTRAGGVRVQPGTWDGRVSVATRTGETRFEVVARGRGLRLASMSDDDEGNGGRDFGAPTDLELSAEGTVDWDRRWVAVPCWRLLSSGVEMAGSTVLETGEDDLWMDLSLDVPRVDLAPVLMSSGLELPPGFPPLLGDLGSAALSARVTGRLRDADSIEVKHRLVFRPPSSPVAALEALKRPFTHTVVRPDGIHRLVLSEGSPDFVPLWDVPSLFVRTLLIAEDAGFWGHPGIDLKEVPVAVATNWVRGERVRGASTISQQLAKNLFLSRRKSYSRKLQELALTLLLESSLGKRRILEIYLNVIEWGPGVYGLRSAACRYFGKEPRELSPKEMVFLVSLVPSPIRYQTSFVKGEVTPRFNALLVNLLAKLRSVDAITEEEYQHALAEPLAFRR